MAKSDDLARRAVACPGWRWLPGMRTLNHGRVIDGTGVAVVDGPRLIAPALDRAWTVPAREVEALPDLSDPATVGALLALVREAWGCHVHLRRWASPAPDMSGKDRSTWEPVDGLGRRLVAGPRVLCETEAGALVAALEAAP